MGSATLSLNMKYTLYANNHTQTVAQTVTQIQTDLTKQKFLAGLDIVDEMLD
jgi:hypothetical protein